MASFEPLLHGAAHTPPPKRRGRPPKAQTQVARQVRALGLEHFAFVRATLLGLDLRENFVRYVQWAEPLSDLRFAQSRLEQILGQILDSGAQIDATLPPDQKITPLLRSLRQAHRELKKSQRLSARQSPGATAPDLHGPEPHAPSPALSIPTLDEWVLEEELDADFFSESELLEQYREAFGLDTEAAPDPEFTPSSPENRASKSPQNAPEIDFEGAGLADAVKRRIRALNRLESLLALPPSPSQALSLWFSHSICARLESLGIVTLAHLVDLISVRGHRWYTHARGIGRAKTAQILAWLSQQSDPEFARALARSVVIPQQRRAIEERNRWGPGLSLVLPAVFGLVPLERLMLPPALNGQGGVFRSPGPNTLDASTDLEAVNAWLAHHQERISTVRSYRKEAERFLLFCAHVLRKSLSSVTAPDCMQYRAFLMQVPPHWIHPMPVVRTDPMWRPFRGQPSAASQKQALVILQAMFEALQSANYVSANPFAAVIKGFNLPSSSMDLGRSLSQAEWRFVAEQAHALGSTAQGRRMRLVLDLLLSTGLRLDELAHAEQENMRYVSVDGEAERAWILEVVGKRRKRRVVPITDDLALRIQEHFEDAKLAHEAMVQSLGEAAGLDRGMVVHGGLGASALPYPKSRPLIYGLNLAVAQWVDVQGQATLQAQTVHKSPQGLSASGIYRTLKRFFKRCSQLAQDAGLDPVHLESASTHWLRHSFGRQAAVSGVPIEIISQAMGHASLTTTSIYLTQERSRMIKELRKMHATVGADSPGTLP